MHAKDATYAFLLPPLVSFNCVSFGKLYYALCSCMYLFFSTYVTFSRKLSIVTRKRYYLLDFEDSEETEVYIFFVSEFIIFVLVKYITIYLVKVLDGQIVCDTSLTNNSIFQLSSNDDSIGEENIKFCINII